MRIQPKQIRIIKLAQRDLGLDDDSYRALLGDLFGVASCTALNVDQGNRLIDELKQKGFRLVARPRPVQKRAKGKNIVHLASREELAKIDAVAALIPWRIERGKELFLAKRLGLKDGKVRTAGDAWKAIEALKKMFENGMKKEHGPAWWSKQHSNPAIGDYITRHRPEEWR